MERKTAEKFRELRAVIVLYAEWLGLNTALRLRKVRDKVPGGGKEVCPEDLLWNMAAERYPGEGEDRRVFEVKNS